MSERQFCTKWESSLVILATGFFSAYLCFGVPTLLESVDYIQMWKPTWAFLKDALQELRLPLWNPYIGLGRPFLGDGQTAVLYPPFYLIFLGERVGVFLLVWIHCCFAVLGMLKLARALHAGSWQAYLMSFTYVGCGGFTGCWATGALPYACALSYVPWLFLYAIRITEPRAWRYIPVYALLLALQFCVANPQVFWFTAIGQIVFIVGRAVRPPIRDAVRDICRVVGLFAVACLWAAALSAVVLLPYLELARSANRVGASPAFTCFHKLTWQDLETLISPVGLLAGPSCAVHNLFIGPIVVLAGLAGLRRVGDRNIRALLAVGIVSLLIGLADSTPLFGLLYKWLPGYSEFRCHEREGLLVAFALICAAGIWLSQAHPQLRAMWTDNFNIPIRVVLFAILLFQGLGLIYATSAIKRIYAYPVFYRHLPDYPFQHVLAAQLRAAGLMETSQPPPRICVPWLLVPANYGMIHHYSSFDAEWSLFLKRPWDYLHSALHIEAPELRNTSVSEDVYTHSPFPYRDVALVAGVDPVSGQLHVITNPSPRAFLVYAAEEVGDQKAILERLANGHDIQDGTLLEKPLGEPLPEKSLLHSDAATVRSFNPNGMLVDVEAKTNALLVLAEAWYPGWRAEIDKKVYDCLPANVWMRAVPVKAGRHQVRFYFHQNHLFSGLLVTLASIGIFVFVQHRSKPDRNSY